MKKSRQALLGLKLTFVVVLALVAAQVATLTLRARVEPPLKTDLELPSANLTAAPTSPDQIIAQTRVLLGSSSPSPKASTDASGRLVASASPGPTAPAGPDSLQGLTLVGTMVGGSLSVAFFNNAQGKQVLVHSDETLGAWKVADIAEDKVILAQGTVKRTIHLPSGQQGSSPASGPGGILPPPPAPALANPPQGPPDKVVIARSEVNTVKDNPGSIMKDFRILPFQKDGRPYGSKVLFLQGGSLLSRMGLQQDDIVLNVNNRPVSNPDDFFMLWQTLQKEDHTTLSLERGGRPVTVQVEIR